MESCLKKLVLDAPETGFQDAERAERKPLVPPGRELVPGGIHWRQMGVDSLPSGVQKVYSSLIEQSPWQLVELGTALSLILNRAFVRSINRKEILRI